MPPEGMQIKLTPVQRLRLVGAFRGGSSEPLTSNQEHRWSDGVDRLLMELQTMLWAGEITVDELGFRVDPPPGGDDGRRMG